MSEKANTETDPETKKESNNDINSQTQESNNIKEEEKKEDDKKEEEKNDDKKEEEKREERKKEDIKEEDKKEDKKEEKKPSNEKRGKNFNLDDYIIMLSIGTGNFSEVHLVEHKTTKILYAMKSFEKRRVESLHKERDVLMEKYALEKISPHKNIIGYYGSSKDDFEMYILFEYINGGDLWHRKVIYGLPSEKLIKFYFIQILQAVKHIHSFNIAHRDLKPENMMITKDNKIIKLMLFIRYRWYRFRKKNRRNEKKRKKAKTRFYSFRGNS